MTDAYVIDGVRTVFGRAGGQLATVRPDDLAAQVIRALMVRNPQVDPAKIDDVYWGATNQSGDDSRNVSRIAAVLAGLPTTVPGVTINRLCGSGIESVVSAARGVKSDELELVIAGGGESMSRAPFVLARAETAFQKAQTLWDSRLGWRSVNPRWRDSYGERSLVECAELTAASYGVSREQQDEFSVRSHHLAHQAWEDGLLDRETIPVIVNESTVAVRDQGIRAEASLETLGALRPLVSSEGSVTAGNSSPMSDGASGLLLASGSTATRYGLSPRARVVAGLSIGTHPDALDGPVSATRLLCKKIDWDLNSIDAIEMTEAYASQAVACITALGVDPDIVNQWGGAIALGHPLAASGGRLITTLINRLENTGGRRGIATMCIGVGQGVSVAIELC